MFANHTTIQMSLILQTMSNSECIHSEMNWEIPIDESGWPCEHNTDLCFEYVFKEEEWNGTLKFSYRCTCNFFFSAVLALKKILIHFVLQISSYVSQKVTLMSLFSLIEMDRGMKSCECRSL